MSENCSRLYLHYQMNKWLVKIITPAEMVRWWQRQKGLYKLTEGEKQSYCHCHLIPRKEHLQGKHGGSSWILFTFRSCSGALEICVACEALYRWGPTLLSAEMWQPLSNLKLKPSDFIFYNLREVEMEWVFFGMRFLSWLLQIILRVTSVDFIAQIIFVYNN